MKTPIILAGLAVWLLTGLAIKHVRYSEPIVLGVIDAERRLLSYMEFKGWQLSERVALGQDERFGTLILKRPYCGSSVAIMLIDLGESNLETYKRATLGNIAYVDQGVRYASPPITRLLLRTMTNSLLEAFGVHVEPSMPIIAIAPASAAEDGLCGTGLIGKWQPPLAASTRSSKIVSEWSASSDATRIGRRPHSSG